MAKKTITINRMYEPNPTWLLIAGGFVVGLAVGSALFIPDPWRAYLWAAVALVNLFGWRGALNRHTRLVREHNMIYGEITEAARNGRS